MPFEIQCALSPAEQELLFVLTHRVRVLTVQQVARTWRELSSPKPLRRLAESGLLIPFSTVAHPELPLERPVIAWHSGPPPDFAAASHELRSRWKQAAVRTPCLIASRAAGRSLGGHGGRFPRESEETHDIHLAAVFLRLMQASPEDAACWMHEDEIKKERDAKGGKLPDAVLCHTGKVIEFGGAYKKAKLEAFHNYCLLQGVEYQRQYYSEYQDLSRSIWLSQVKPLKSAKGRPVG